MIVYLIIFFITLFISIQFQNRSKVSFTFFFTFVMALGVFVGIADMLGGYDRYIYGQTFDVTAEDFTKGLGFIGFASKIFPYEQGYAIYNSIMSIFTINRYVFIFITTLLIYACVARHLYKYTEKPFFALVIFLGLMFFFTFTYIRQIMAMCIIWFAVPYVREHKFLPFALIVLLAASFHNSAIYFMALYFIPLKKFRPWQIVTFMALCLAVGMIGVADGLFGTYRDAVGSDNRLSDYNASGFRIEYLLEAVFFLWMILKNYKYISQDKVTCTLLNLSLMFCAILLLFIKSEQGGRIAWYSAIGIIAVLTQLCHRPQLSKYRQLLTFVCLCLYIRIIVVWGVLLTPYKTFFTEGHRDGDFIYNKYEYDINYDRDKFYK